MNSLADFLEFIRFSHTVFALPFALGAMFLAARGLPSPATFAGILAAMVCARTAAMTFNRLVDWEIDKRNPRTEGRHRLVAKRVATAWCVAASAGFVLSARALNDLCLLLSPVALGIIFSYSLTKRFTHFAHFFLGLALSAAPVGAWIAVTGTLDFPPLVLAAAVLCWVTGFDLIYATQDYEVDKREGLHSMVVRLGIPGAMRLAVWLHVAALAGLVGFGFAAGAGISYFVSLGVVTAALFYEHIEARRGDVAAINRAFFQANAIVGVAFVAGTFLDHIVP
ncbi:MAG: UbiA-like polyprenyltransferase [Terrimicrobiaceae bacterium]|jgi:4-hydroxybenzoate polyprenyltransferase|nr:putative 4-hydroxybenzoate polyprenyltransferase [Terrimicrobiaceae bacterium]